MCFREVKSDYRYRRRSEFYIVASIASIIFLCVVCSNHRRQLGCSSHCSSHSDCAFFRNFETDAPRRFKYYDWLAFLAVNIFEAIPAK